MIMANLRIRSMQLLQDLATVVAFPMMYVLFWIFYTAILLLLVTSVCVIWAVSRPPEKLEKGSQDATSE